MKSSGKNFNEFSEIFPARTFKKTCLSSLFSYMRGIIDKYYITKNVVEPFLANIFYSIFIF